jgi:hypothetical protein
MCVVRFSPTKESTATVRKGGSADIKPDGTFEAFTIQPGDGLYLGEYGVSFGVWANATDPNSNLLPVKYMSPQTTEMKVLVDGDKDDLNFVIEKGPGAGGAKGG